MERDRAHFLALNRLCRFLFYEVFMSGIDQTQKKQKKKKRNGLGGAMNMVD